jgi:integrase
MAVCVFLAGEGLVDVKKAFVAACSDAGIADFHFQDLRHTFATRLGDAECNATTIAVGPFKHSDGYALHARI